MAQSLKYFTYFYFTHMTLPIAGVMSAGGILVYFIGKR